MRIRARAASLCAAAFLVLAAVPAAAQAQSPTMHGVEWGDATGAGLLSSAVCPPEGQTKTYTFSFAGLDTIHGAVGTIREDGSFTLLGTATAAKLIDFQSTFSGSSATATIEGARTIQFRHFRAQAGVSCSSGEWESSGYDLLGVSIQTARTEHRLTEIATGAVTTERGYAFVGLSSWPRYNSGQYVTVFRRDTDLDLRDDFVDNCPEEFNGWQSDMDGDGAGDECDPDLDGDSHDNIPDNCDYVPNPGQEDADHDGTGDVCDPRYDEPDADRDGVLDRADNCAGVPNPQQEDSGGSALGDACEDRDGDSVADLVDNCADDANPTQANADGDAAGDACDPDDDGDGVADGSDNCPAAFNPFQRDSDSDGAGDECDGVFDSNDGFAGGGGTVGRSDQVSFALHRGAGGLHASGHVVDGRATVRLLDLTGLRSDGDRVVAVGGASINGGDRIAYRLEIVDSTNAYALEIGEHLWAGTLTKGNLVVK
ncbi:MAG: thrombospondin type 3 repeat-containing protein [Actinomycetota bacterium]|nr:thrombospondin type 3 repeat-containing protein [Actinomycetota bacterium]